MKILILKTAFVLTLIITLNMVIIKYNEKQHKKYTYIGNSILEKPSIMVADSLISIK